MSAPWINATPKLKAGVALINTLEAVKLRSLLNRIVTYMQQDFRRINVPRIFSDEEELKLEKSLGLDVKDVQLVIDTSFLILQQAAYLKVKPETFHSRLIDGLQLDPERATIIASIWFANAGPIIDRLKHLSVLPQQLTDLSWTLMVETSTDVISKQKEPTALLELSLQSSEASSNSKLQVQMRQKELLMLYKKLEHVQLQLDVLK